MLLPFSIETGPGSIPPAVLEGGTESKSQGQSPSILGRRQVRNDKATGEMQPKNPNKFRLERFGKAMTGTDGWEAPGAILNG